MGHPRPNAVSRRQIATIAAASMLGRCAAVPDIGGLTAKEVGLSDRHAGAPPRRSSADSVDALQQQYDLQNALSSEPMIFGNKITLLTSATDALRAQLLEWAGYRTQVLEFVSTEHTAKNLMIAAVKARPPGDEALAARIRAFAAFYGIRHQSLARQLGFELGPDEAV